MLRLSDRRSPRPEVGNSLGFTTGKVRWLSLQLSLVASSSRTLNIVGQKEKNREYSIDEMSPVMLIPMEFSQLASRGAMVVSPPAVGSDAATVNGIV